MIFSRITPGPVEKFLITDAEFKNEATCKAAMDVFEGFKKDRSRGSDREYVSFPIFAENQIGCVNLLIHKDYASAILGTSGRSILSSIRLEFPSFTIIEMHHKLGKGQIERKTILAQALHFSDPEKLSLIGKTIADIMTLPSPLAEIYLGMTVSDICDHCAGSVFIFE